MYTSESLVIPHGIHSANGGSLTFPHLADKQGPSENSKVREAGVLGASYPYRQSSDTGGQVVVIDAPSEFPQREEL